MLISAFYYFKIKTNNKCLFASRTEQTDRQAEEFF